MDGKSLSRKIKIGFLFVIMFFGGIEANVLYSNDLPPMPHIFQNALPADALKVNANLDHLMRLVNDKNALIKSLLPVGTILIYSGKTVPSGFYECDGRPISRGDHSELFAVLNTMYGAGDGSSTFNLPDYRGYFLRGLDNGAGRDPSADVRNPRPDGVGGDRAGTIQDDDFGSHTHLEDARPGYSRHGGGGSGDNVYALRFNYARRAARLEQLRETEASGGEETRPKNIAVMYIMKVR